MEIKFTVHSVEPSSDIVEAEVNGQTLRATIDALEVEMTSDHYGSLKLRFIGAEIQEAKALFEVDSTYVWTL